MKYVALLVLLISAASAATLCPNYYCFDFPGTQNVTDPYWYFCSEKVESLQVDPTNNNQVDSFDTYYLGACPADTQHTFCNLNQLSHGVGTFCTPTPDAENLLPGQSCKANSECLSNSCNNLVCLGLGAGSSCDSDNKCDVGLFCNSDTCANVRVEGESCDAQTPCSPRFVCTNGSCSKWFSAPEGFNPNTNDVRACSTGYIEGNQCKNGNKRVRKDKIGTHAESGVCEYTDSTGATISQKEASVCAYSATPAAYCKIGAGDQQYLDVKSLAESFATNSNLPECHVDLGLMCDAALNINRRGAYAFSYLPDWMNLYAQMENNPQCVKWSLSYYQWFVQTGDYPYKPGEKPVPPTPEPQPEAANPNFVVSCFVLLVSIVLLSM